MVVSTPAALTNGPHRSTDDDSVNELSRLLLQGWTMLAETCPSPNCHMPLARSRQGAIVCTQCHTHPTATTTAPNENHNHDNDETTTPNAATRSRTPVGEPTPRRLTEALGDKLLQGWTLTDHKCPSCTTPLVRDDRRRFVCVACDAHHDVDQVHAQPTMPTPQIAPAPHIAPTAPTSSPPAVAEAVAPPRTPPPPPLPPASSPTDASRIAATREHRVVNRDTEHRVINRGCERRVAPRASDGVGVERGTDRGARQAAEARPEPRAVAAQSHVPHPPQPLLDVDHELRLCETAAARRLALLRARLPAVTEAEAGRVVCAAMAEACNVIRAARQARGLPPGLPKVALE